MTKVSAVVFRGSDGEMYVLPSEFLETMKVHPSSHDNVLSSLVDGAKDMKLNDGLSYVGQIYSDRSEEAKAAGGGTAWPHYLPDNS